MSLTARQRATGGIPSTMDLPYGPLPARPEREDTPQPQSQQRDHVLRLSRLEPDAANEEPAGSEPNATEAQAAQQGDEDQAETSSELDVAAARGDSDDDVHFGVAAKALGVSRKTIERMVKRGQLERGPSQTPATVSKRALVSLLEKRRRDVSPFMGGSGPAQRSPGYPSVDAAWPLGTSAELQEVLRPVLEPLLEEVVAARTRAAVLESQMEGIAARSMQERARNELLLTIATGSRRERRKARRLAFRHYVLGDQTEP